MNETIKTLLAVAAACVLAGAAFLTRPKPITPETFSDQGELFFADFTDPTAARSLEVIGYDEATATYQPFKIQFDGARWVIPSHHNYPADAQTSLAQAASAFVGLHKEQVVSDRAADHEALGVVSPDDESAPLTGRGTRVTIKDAQGKVLSDVIIGKAAATTAAPEGNPSAAPSRRYVRLPDKNRVYALTFTKTFSTRFGDWVETDLLKLAGQPVGRIVVDRYEIDETAGLKKTTERVTIARDSGAAVAAATHPWTVDAEPGGPPGPDEEVVVARIDEAVSALSDLKIAGVRPKPAKLAAWFAGESKTITQSEVLDLQARGFFVTREGQFVANEGETTVACADGVVYTLYFGEVLFGSGESISAGTTDALATGDSPSAEEEPKSGQENRYAFVRVSFDPTLVPEPTPPAASMPPVPAPTQQQPAEEAHPQPPVESAPPQEPHSPAAQQSPPPEVPAPMPQTTAPAPSPSAPPTLAPTPDPAQQEYERSVAERQAKLEAGRKRADALAKRFSGWYYVIDASAFAKIRPTRAELIKPKPAPGPAAAPQTGGDAPPPAEGND